MSPNGCHSVECVNAAKFCDIDFGDDADGDGRGRKLGAKFLLTRMKSDKSNDRETKGFLSERERARNCAQAQKHSSW